MGLMVYGLPGVAVGVVGWGVLTTSDYLADCAGFYPRGFWDDIK